MKEKIRGRCYLSCHASAINLRNTDPIRYYSIRHPDTVQCRAYYSSCISSPFPARIETCNIDRLKVTTPGNSYRCRCPGLDPYQCCLLRNEPSHLPFKLRDRLPQGSNNIIRHAFFKIG